MIFTLARPSEAVFLYVLSVPRRTVLTSIFPNVSLSTCVACVGLSVYDDVVDALKLWTEAGKRIFIYSSGSVAAQKLLFAHTRHGDLCRVRDPLCLSRRSAVFCPSAFCLSVSGSVCVSVGLSICVCLLSVSLSVCRAFCLALCACLHDTQLLQPHLATKTLLDVLALRSYQVTLTPRRDPREKRAATPPSPRTRACRPSASSFSLTAYPVCLSRSSAMPLNF